jgi:O-phosphoseryl-tRNA synthetase
MRLLIIHADKFVYQPTEKSPLVSAYPRPSIDPQQFFECLVVLIAVERVDVEDVNSVVYQAVHEISQVALDLDVDTIVIYPYAHLSSDLASGDKVPKVISRIANEMTKDISSLQIEVAPFGWYKAFHLHCKGHPRSEIYKEISPDAVSYSSRIEKKRGETHPVNALKYRLRDIFLELGFDEIVNPSIVAEEEVYKQYGPEAPLILDRVFYLAGLPRPDIGISDSEWEHIQRIAPQINSRGILSDFFRSYKEGEIASDDLIEEAVNRLKVKEFQAVRMLNEVFPQLRNLEPISTKKTLRSHMTAVWFPLLEKCRRKAVLPLKLFSIGPRFRREQREDAHHLFESTTASLVVMDDSFTMKNGKDLTIDILSRLGFCDCSFKTKAVTSNYYEQGTDTEVYGQYADQRLEIANIGFYNSRSLSNYDIANRVFNLGFGVERLAMIFEDAQDIRRLVYPVLYQETEFSDSDIVQALSVTSIPSSDEGIDILNKLNRTVTENKDRLGPKEVIAYEGGLLGAKVEVYFYNWDVDRSMLGRAGMNEVIVYNGEIYGLPQTSEGLSGRFLEAYEKGHHTGLIFIDLLMQKVVSDLEFAVRNMEQCFDVRFKMIGSLEQINLSIPSSVRNWIRGKQKSMYIKGPIFAGVKSRIVYNK